MAIRLRTVDGIRVALCAVETDEEPGDVYLDDSDDHALRIKLWRDWQSEANCRAAMDSQKRRDAGEEHAKWAATQEGAGEP